MFLLLLGGLTTFVTVPANSSNIEAPSAWANKVLALKNSSWATTFGVYIINTGNTGITSVKAAGGISINDEAHTQILISAVGGKLMIQNTSNESAILEWRVL